MWMFNLVWYVLSAIFLSIVTCVLVAMSAFRWRDVRSLRLLELESCRLREGRWMRERRACILAEHLRYYAFLASQRRPEWLSGRPVDAAWLLAAAQSDLDCYRMVQFHAIRHNYDDGTSEVLCVAIARAMRAVRRYEREVRDEALETP